METVSLAINETGLVRGLRHSFTNRDTLFKELLQNTERAGASIADVTITAQGASMIQVEIRDDGCGIEDMAKLLTIATSGWSDDVIESRMPYGMGFLAAVYAAKSIQVYSRGRSIAFTCDEVLDFQPVQVQPDKASMVLPGSRIVLNGLAMSLAEAEYAFKRHAKGFPIRVNLNGRELDRPHALSSAYLARSCGHMLIEGMDIGASSSSGKLYLQSFEVFRWGGQTDTPSVIVHLDPKRFIARLPDRDRLIDEDLRVRDVMNEIGAVWREYLEEAASRLPVEELLSTYYRAIRDYHPGLLDRIDWLPSGLVQKISEPPSLRDMQFGMYQASRHLDRRDIESGQARIVTGNLPADDDDGLNAAWMFAYLNGYHHVRDLWLCDTHWANAFIQDISEMELEIEVHGLRAKGYFSGHYCGGDILICEAYTLRAKDGGTGVSLGEVRVEKEVLFDNGDGTTRARTSGCFIVPDGARNPGAAVEQASDYQDEWSYREDIYEEDVADFNRKVSELRGAYPSDVLLDILMDKASLREYPALHGRRFLLSIGTEGCIEGVGEVTLEMPPHQG